MHFWGDTSVIGRYKKAYKGSALLMEIEREGQEFYILPNFV
jgi:hypothetical protein